MIEQNQYNLNSQHPNRIHQLFCYNRLQNPYLQDLTQINLQLPLNNIMEQSNQNSIQIVAFRKIQKPAEVSEKITHWGVEQHLINFIILDYGGSTQQRKRLKEVQIWCRQRNSDIRFSKITKQQAFLQTYRDALNSPIKTYFLTCLSIEQISKQPLQQFYQQFLTKQSDLKEFNKQAEINLRKISFIILKDNMQKIDKRNYFHANIALVTSEVKIILQVIQQNIKILAKLRPTDSSSSVNSDEVQHFGQSLKEFPKLVTIYKSQSSQIDRSNDYEVLKLLNNTPGVGTYHIEGSH